MGPSGDGKNLRGLIPGWYLNGFDMGLETEPETNECFPKQPLYRISIARTAVCYRLFLVGTGFLQQVV